MKRRSPALANCFAGSATTRSAPRRSRAAPPPASQAALGGAVIDILEGVDKTDRDAARQPGEGVGKRLGARPAHPREQRWQARPATGADQPKAAVGGRPEHEIVVAQQAKGGGDMPRLERRDVG